MLVYDERELAEKFFKEGFTRAGFRFYEALLVAKYLRFVLGYKDQRCKRALLEFCEKWDKNFRRVPKRESIKKILRESKKEFRKTNSMVSIWKEEVEEIKKIKNFKFQKILLCLLMICKIKGKSYIHTHEWKYVRKIISKNISNYTVMEVIREAYKKGLIYEPKYESHEFSFLKENGIVGMSIHGEKEAYNLSNIYQSYCGGVLGYCTNCGCEFVKETRNQELCTNHRTERKREKYRRYNEKRKGGNFA